MDKQYILDEIRRTADENGGAPLGRTRFAGETGIKIADWSGRFWARWGDALCEAGLEPNVLQIAYQPDELMERFVALARELGHFPVNGYWRL